MFLGEFVPVSTFRHNFIPLIYYGPWFRHYYQELFCSTEVAFLASALKGRGRCCNVPCQFIRLILVLKLPDQLRKLSILLILPVIEGLGVIVKSIFKFRFAGTMQLTSPFSFFTVALQTIQLFRQWPLSGKAFPLLQLHCFSSLGGLFWLSTLRLLLRITDSMLGIQLQLSFTVFWLKSLEYL